MKPDFQRALIPSDEVLQLIGALNAMKDELLNAAQQWELLDENGHVPATPSYTALLQHATDAQDLSRDVLGSLLTSPGAHTTPPAPAAPF
ncbi:hypothetical protein [Streptomyces tibetensis]|uniref:hypothetical protein n=1 Tax=Streptomyces tibetensis TaxID=2382123 RepID=UPI0033E6A585